MSPFLLFFWSKKRRPSVNVVLEPTDEYNDPRLFSVVVVSLFFGNGVSTYHTQYIDDVRNVCSAPCFSLVERVLAPRKLEGREERGRRKKEERKPVRVGWSFEIPVYIFFPLCFFLPCTYTQESENGEGCNGTRESPPPMCVVFLSVLWFVALGVRAIYQYMNEDTYFWPQQRKKTKQ